MVLMVVLSLLLACEKPDTSGKKAPITAEEPWSWENPYTFAEVLIPPAWHKTDADQMQEAMLTLQHNTGKSLIYLMIEESLNDLTLEEYVEAITPTVGSELGVEEFEFIKEGPFGPLAQATGAKYFGDTLTGTYVRIWSHGNREFWRSAAITSMEYKSLEYEARELLEALTSTSSP